MVKQAVKQGALSSVAGAGDDRRRQARQVDRTDTRRQPKAGASLAVAHAAGGGVHRQHQGLVAGSFGALHQRLGEAAVVLQVQLKPQRAAARVGQNGLRHALQRHAGLGAEHHARAQGSCGIGHGQFAVGVRHALEGHGRQQDGVRQRAAQQLHPGVATCQRPQHAGPQGQRVPGAAVGAQGDLVARATAEVGPGVVVELLACACASWSARVTRPGGICCSAGVSGIEC